MPTLLVLLTLYIPFIQESKPPKNTQPTITIVETRELLSLINTKDDTLRLFNFWATWCKPCVGELPYFEGVNNSRKGEKFHLYLVSLDFRKDFKKKLIPFLKKKQIESTVLLFDGGNPNDWIDKISPEWNGSIPASLVVYKGQSCFEENSFENIDALNKFINRCKTNFKS